MDEGLDRLVFDLTEAVLREAQKLVDNYGADGDFLAESCQFACRSCAIDVASYRVLKSEEPSIFHVVTDTVRLRAAASIVG